MIRKINLIIALSAAAVICLVVCGTALANGCTDIHGTCRPNTCNGEEQIGGAFDACIDSPGTVCCVAVPCDPNTQTCPGQETGTTESNPSQAELNAILNNTKFTAEEQQYLDQQKAAQDIADLKRQTASLNYANIGKPSDLIARAINLLMAFIGSIALVLYIVGGFLWMAAGGNDERVGKAKKIFIWTSLGLVAMGASYMIVRTILARVG